MSLLRKLAFVKMFYSASQQLFSLGIIACFILHVNAIGLDRSVGRPGDPVFANAVKKCNATLPSNYQFGACSRLIDCVFDNTSEAAKAGLASGTSIAALLPTILALIGRSNLSLKHYSVDKREYDTEGISTELE